MDQPSTDRRATARRSDGFPVRALLFAGFWTILGLLGFLTNSASVVWGGLTCGQVWLAALYLAERQRG